MTRTIAVLVVLFVCGVTATARAEKTNNCRVCADTQRACAKNHSRAACGTEYEICMKHCRAK
jgi:hypothetical protein